MISFFVVFLIVFNSYQHELHSWIIRIYRDSIDWLVDHTNDMGSGNSRKKGAPSQVVSQTQPIGNNNANENSQSAPFETPVPQRTSPGRISTASSQRKATTSASNATLQIQSDQVDNDHRSVSISRMLHALVFDHMWPTIDIFSLADQTFIDDSKENFNGIPIMNEYSSDKVPSQQSRRMSHETDDASQQSMNRSVSRRRHSQTSKTVFPSEQKIIYRYCEHCRQARIYESPKDSKVKWIVDKPQDHSVHIDMDKYDDVAMKDKTFNDYGYNPDSYQYQPFLTIQRFNDRANGNDTYYTQPFIAKQEPRITPTHTPLPNFCVFQNREHRLNQPYSIEMFAD
jgi:hypothetical protein